jgi:hypothetical protein
MAKKDGAFPAFSLIYGIVAIPYNFLVGFVVGLAAPVAAIAAMVLGVRFFTGKMPFLRLGGEADEERRLELELVEQEQAHDLFEAEKERILEDLGSFRDEMKALIEQAKATADKTSGAEAGEAG